MLSMVATFALPMHAVLALVASTPVATAPRVDELLVVAAQDLPRMWVIVRYGALKFDRRKLRDHGHACVSVGYVIEPDGRTSTARVLKSDPAGVFDASALSAVEKSRYKPGSRNANRAPVYTTATYTAFVAPAADPARMLARVSSSCDVEIVLPDARPKR